MINAGAILVHSLLPAGDEDERTALLLRRYSALAGVELEVCEDVLDAERTHADRNLGLAHLLADAGRLPISAREAVAGYLAQCSVLVTAPQLAVMGATLAAGGTNPVTGERVLDEGGAADDVRDAHLRHVRRQRPVGGRGRRAREVRRLGRAARCRARGPGPRRVVAAPGRAR